MFPNLRNHEPIIILEEKTYTFYDLNHKGKKGDEIIQT